MESGGVCFCVKADRKHREKIKKGTKNCPMLFMLWCCLNKLKLFHSIFFDSSELPNVHRFNNNIFLNLVSAKCVLIILFEWPDNLYKATHIIFVQWCDSNSVRFARGGVNKRYFAAFV